MLFLLTYRYASKLSEIGHKTLGECRKKIAADRYLTLNQQVMLFDAITDFNFSLKSRYLFTF